MEENNNKWECLYELLKVFQEIDLGNNDKNDKTLDL